MKSKQNSVIHFGRVKSVISFGGEDEDMFSVTSKIKKERNISSSMFKKEVIPISIIVL